MSNTMKNPSTMLFAVAGILVVGLIAVTVTKGRTPSSYDGFAQCLSDNGAQMFGAWWCPHCENQKAAFGSAFDNINNVECSPDRTRNMSAECKQAGIESYPTWRFSDGTELRGEQSFATLGSKTGCDVPQE